MGGRDAACECWLLMGSTEDLKVRQKDRYG